VVYSVRPVKSELARIGRRLFEVSTYERLDAFIYTQTKGFRPNVPRLLVREALQFSVMSKIPEDIANGDYGVLS
jgi:hypothetical protein